MKLKFEPNKDGCIYINRIGIWFGDVEVATIFRNNGAPFVIFTDGYMRFGKDELRAIADKLDELNNNKDKP